jgi:hypothetical protein
MRRLDDFFSWITSDPHIQNITGLDRIVKLLLCTTSEQPPYGISYSYSINYTNSPTGGQTGWACNPLHLIEIPVRLLETYLLPSTTYREHTIRHRDDGLVINFTSKKTRLPNRVKENVGSIAKCSFPGFRVSRLSNEASPVAVSQRPAICLGTSNPRQSGNFVIL